jgi:PhnB protein
MFDPAKGYPRVVPYFRYLDPASAVRWLVEVVGATEVLRMTLPDGRIGHAELVIGNSPASHVGAATRTTLRTMTLVFVDDVDATTAKATQHGGTVVDAPTNQPWGLRQAIVGDSEGYLWELSTHLRDVPPESWGATQRGSLPG